VQTARQPHVRRVPQWQIAARLVALPNPQLSALPLAQRDAQPLKMPDVAIVALAPRLDLLEPDFANSIPPLPHSSPELSGVPFRWSPPRAGGYFPLSAPALPRNPGILRHADSPRNRASLRLPACRSAHLALCVLPSSSL
jgi:hypothetical protein